MLVALLWGINFVSIDVGLATVPPLVFLAIRFVLVAFPAILFVPRPAVPIRRLVAIGLCSSLGQFALLYVALHLGMPPGLASLVLQAQVVFTVLIAAGVLRERPTARQSTGIVVALLGLGAIVASHWTGAGWLPIVVTIGAAGSWALGNVLTRAAGVRGGLGVVVWSAPVVPVPALALALIVDGPRALVRTVEGFGPAALASTVYTVVFASLVGYTLWNGLLARNPAARVTPFALLVPVVGLLAAWIAFGEAPSVLDLVAGAVMITGIAVATLRGRPARVPAAPPKAVSGEHPRSSGMRSSAERSDGGRHRGSSSSPQV